MRPLKIIPKKNQIGPIGGGGHMTLSNLLYDDLDLPPLLSASPHSQIQSYNI